MVYTVHTFIFSSFYCMSYTIVLLVIAIFVIPMFVRIIKQGSLGMIETLGRFSRIAQPGVHFIIP